MDDPSKFANMAEYQAAYYAIGFLFLTELAIWIGIKAGGGRGRRKAGDRGTVWLIILGWGFSVWAGAFFRSQSVPAMMRGWLWPHVFYYFGVVFIVLGVILRCAAVLTLRRAFTYQVQTSDNQHLIQTGLYHIVRNPAYSGSILSLLGVTLAYRSIGATLSAICVCLLCYGIRIHVEEKALKLQFGEEFELYCSKTRFRMIPGIY